MAFIIGKKSKPASGGFITLRPNGVTVHVFDTPGVDNFITNDPLLVDILVVGAGGGSGYSGPPLPASDPIIDDKLSAAGGGGAGSVLKRKWQPVGAGATYPVIVGGAGYSQSDYKARNDPDSTPIPTPLLSTPGGDTIFNLPGNNGVPTFRAPGGAHGGESVDWARGYINPTPTNNPSGSGGGGSEAWSDRFTVSGGIGANEPGFGFNGGPTLSNQIGGGGGGAGSAGQPGGSASQIASNPEISRGGDGLPISDFTENPLDYAGVGGSGTLTPSPGPGSGGVDNGWRNPQDRNSPTHYGRGATCGSPDNRQSQDGVVIIKYL